MADHDDNDEHDLSDADSLSDLIPVFEYLHFQKPVRREDMG